MDYCDADLLSALFYKLDVLLCRYRKCTGHIRTDDSAMPCVSVLCDRQEEWDCSGAGFDFYGLSSDLCVGQFHLNRGRYIRPPNL